MIDELEYPEAQLADYYGKVIAQIIISEVRAPEACKSQVGEGAQVPHLFADAAAESASRNPGPISERLLQVEGRRGKARADTGSAAGAGVGWGRGRATTLRH